MGKRADAAVAGVYQRKQGDLGEQTQPSVWWEPARGACEDASLAFLSRVGGADQAFCSAIPGRV